LLVHRGWAADSDVLMMRVRDEVGAYVYPVHRLDRGASGVVLFALTAEVARVLGHAFEHGELDKRYVALVRGVPPEHGVIDHPVPRKPDGERVAAITDYVRLEVFGRYSLVEARPHTGRFHQIRRHLKHLSCPLIGDSNYGKGEHNRFFRERYGLARLALHAASVALEHPTLGTPLLITAPMPADLAEPLDRLRADHPPSET
jgi:tRNA pseudouridine65 synthase